MYSEIFFYNRLLDSCLQNKYSVNFLISNHSSLKSKKLQLDILEADSDSVAQRNEFEESPLPSHDAVARQLYD